jgi:hypothetical protein
MRTLEDQIADIEKLDALRQHARQLQKEAIDALTAKVYIPQPRPPGKLQVKKAARANWELPTDDIEKALLLRALAKLKPEDAAFQGNREQTQENLLADLGKYGPADWANVRGALDYMPIFRCALALQGFAQTPGYVLCDSALACFHRVVQELNEVAAPEWASGAARAGYQAMPTAFVAAECARGLIALIHTLEQTAAAAELLGKEAARRATSSINSKAWQSQEKAFRAKAFGISFGIIEPDLLFSLHEAAKRPPGDVLKEIARRLRELPSDELLPKGTPPSPPETKGRMRDIVTHHLQAAAKDIASTAVRKLRDAIQPPSESSEPRELATGIAASLRRGIGIIRELLAPLEPFATSVIDRELAAGTPHLEVRVDAAELVFAANLLGLVSDWKKPKIKAAYEAVKPLLSVNGRLLSLRAFDVQPRGYRLNVQAVEVVRQLADLVGKLDVEPEAEWFERLMRPFEDTRVRGEKDAGWATDLPSRESRSLWWMTGLVATGLSSLIHMLDESINRQVLKHFQVREPDSLKLGLDELFYPDFGFAASEKKDSIALKLQQLRTHAGVGPAEPRPLFSMILYGPPGTGKTTLVEALAKSAAVRLIEITPSDILVGGAEAVERRTRHVFQALSKLTHVVILFDEFDPILLDRSKRDPDKIPTSVIEFLTPGMLPKLKALNDAAKSRRFSYVLATNFLDALDPAVTRGGRFDDKCGIYPPDPVSRLGRLLDQLSKLTATCKNVAADLVDKIKKEPKGDHKKNLEEHLKTVQSRIVNFDAVLADVLRAVKYTMSAPMDKLGRPGWYTMPREDKDFDSTLFGMILHKQTPKGLTPFKYKTEEWQLVDPEAFYERDKDKFNDLRAKRDRITIEELPPLTDKYWIEWEKIDKWDKKFAEVTKTGTDWSNVLRGVDKLLGGDS